MVEVNHNQEGALLTGSVVLQLRSSTIDNADYQDQGHQQD